MNRFSPLVSLLCVAVLSTFALAASAQSPPEIVAPSEFQRDPGEFLLFNVSTSDPDGDRVTLEAADLPVGSRFLLDGNGNGSFSWRPTDADEGVHTITLIATDTESPPQSTRAFVVITVGEPNLPPVLAPIGDQMATVGILLVVPLSATDPEGDALVFSTSPVLHGSLIQAGPPGTATYEYTPPADAVGNQVLTFRVSDGSGMDEEQVVISVGDVNMPPVLAPIGDRQVEAGDVLEIALSATDADGDALAFSALGLPDGLSLVDAGDGTARIEGASDVIGLHPVTVTVTDDGTPPEAAAETFTIDVREPAEEPDLVVMRARWRPGRLGVRGAGALPGTMVDIHDTLTGEHLGSAVAGSRGFFMAALHPAVPPCEVEVRWGAHTSAPAAVRDAPKGCSAEPLTEVWAHWRCPGLFVTGRGAPSRAAVRVYDAESGALLGVKRATRRGRFVVRTRPDSKPNSVQVSVQVGRDEHMLDPVGVSESNRGRSAKSCCR